MHMDFFQSIHIWHDAVEQISTDEIEAKLNKMKMKHPCVFTKLEWNCIGANLAWTKVKD